MPPALSCRPRPLTQSNARLRPPTATRNSSERSKHAIGQAGRARLSPSARWSLAGAAWYLQSLPLDRLAESAARIIAEEGLTALQYGGGQGTEDLRRQICEVMAAEGILDAAPENIVITAGSQSAQDVATKVFCNPGDVVLVEDPTYVGALNTFEAYQVEVATTPMDGDGIVPEQLEARIAALQAEGKNIKFLYTIPSFNNPSGITSRCRSPAGGSRDTRRNREHHHPSRQPHAGRRALTATR